MENDAHIEKDTLSEVVSRIVGHTYSEHKWKGRRCLIEKIKPSFGVKSREARGIVALVYGHDTGSWSPSKRWVEDFELAKLLNTAFPKGWEENKAAFYQCVEQLPPGGEYNGAEGYLIDGLRLQVARTVSALRKKAGDEDIESLAERVFPERPIYQRSLKRIIRRVESGSVDVALAASVLDRSRVLFCVDEEHPDYTKVQNLKSKVQELIPKVQELIPK